MKSRRGLTLLEVLSTVAVLAILAALITPAVSAMRLSMWRGVSVNSLQQLAAAGAAYRADHGGQFWRYREDNRAGTKWWFGFESIASQRAGEGNRWLDPANGPLGPYGIDPGSVQSDPAFLHVKPRHKPKYKDGSFGYGYNATLGGGAMGRGRLATQWQFEQPAQVVVFATCAQVNTFQPPASAENPLLEEFFLIDEKEITVHFRYGGKALAAMLDGSLREIEPDASTIDGRMPQALVGRFAPVGSRRFLGEQP
jgi:prepilin-type N-terminal cleavage/methylation domain-containing protein